MRKLKLFLSLLMLFTFSLGTIWAADELKATFVFTDSGWGIPTSGTNKTEASFTRDGYTIKLAATTNYKQNSGYLILGKANSTLTLPAFTWKTTKIEVVGHSGASASVVQNIYVGSTAVSTATTGANGVTNVYEINSNYQAAGNVYVFTVTSAHNTQIDTVRVYSESSSSSPSISIKQKDGSAIPAAGIDFGSHDKNTYDEATATYNVYDSVIIKVANADKLTSNIKLETTTSKFGVVTTSISKSDLDANGEKKVAIYARTNTDDGEYTSYLRVTSNKTPVEFDTVDVKLTHKVLGPSITFVENNTSNPISTMAFGNVGQRFQKSFVYGIQYKKLEAGSLSFEITGTDADAFAFYSDADKTVNISSAGDGPLSYLSFHQATEVVGDYSATLKVTGCGLPTAGVTIPITMSVKAPEFTTSVSSIDFGNLKQDEQGIMSDAVTFTLNAKYLTLGIALNCYGLLFDVRDDAGYSVINPDDDGNINATIKVRAALGWSGTNNSYLIVSGVGASSEFEDIIDLVTIKSKIIPAYPVSFQVYDNDRGTITINGKASDEYGRVKVYVVDGTEEITAVANSKLGYKFAEWQVANADKDKVTIDDKTSANATVTVSSQPEDLIWAMFEFDCTPLSAPSAFDYLSTTYNSINLKWQWVWEGENKAKTYHIRAIPVDDPDFPIEKNVTLTDEQVAESTVYYTFTGLDANTEYDFEIWGTSKAEGFCSTGKVAGVSSVITADYPAATLTLSENGVERTYEGTHKLNDMIPLPSEVVTGIVGKEFMGWSASSSCTTAPEYNKGQQYKLSAVSNKLYAVYATATPGTPTDHNLGSATFNGSNTGGNTASTGYTLTTNKTADKTGYIQDSGTKDATIIHVQISASSQIISEQPSAIIVSAKLGGSSAKNPLGYDVYAVLVDENGDAIGSPVVLTDKITNSNGSDFSAELPINNYADVRGVKIYHMKEDGWNVRYYNMSLKYQTGGEMSYSAYTTTGARLLALPTFTPAEGTYTEAKNIAISAAEGTIYYNVDSDSDPTSASTAYSSAIALNTYGEHVIKAIAIDGDNKSNVATATYFMNLPFASLEALVAADLASETPNVTVSFSDVEITSISSNKLSVYLNVKDKDGENDIQLFNYNALEESWAVGGTLSGTVTGEWKLFSSKWELVITSWTTGITYAKPAPTLSWSANSATVKKGATDNVFPTLTNPDALSVTYSSTDETVATIASNGDITLLKAGTTTIKASFAGNDDYRAVVVSYTLTVQKAAEGVLKLYNNGVVDFGNVRVGTSSVGSEVLRVDGSKLTPNSELEVSIDGTDGYFEIQVPSDGKIDVDENGVIDDYAINIVPTEAALASVGEKVSTLRFHSADLAEDSLATIKMTVANKYAITVPDITGGTLGWSPAKPDKAFAGAEFTLTATPSTGYEGGTIKILKASNDSEVTDDVLSGSTLTMPAFAIKVVVTFTEIVKTDAPISWYSNTKVTKKYGASEWLNPFTWRTLTNEENLEVTVTSSNTDVIETMQKDEYNHWYPAAVKAAGTTTITATFAGNDTYNETSVSYELEILKGNAPLSWNKENGSGTIRKKTGNDFATLNNTQNLPVTFSSSNAAIASVDASTGAISMHKGGEVLISANLADHACYRDTAVSYNLTVNKLQLTLQFGRGSEDFDESEYTINLNNTSDTWGPGNRVNSTIYGDLQELAELRSSDESIATINTTYNVPIATGKGGSTVISLGYATNDSIIGDTISYTLIVVAKEKAAAGLAWSAESANVRFGSSSNVYPTLTNPNTLAVTYESTDESIATIAANGSITLKANGSTTIKAIFAGDDDYLAATVTYTLNVSAGVVTTTPSPVAIDFGEVLLGDDGANYTATFTLHIENLTEGQYNQVKISSANCEILAPTNDFATDMNRDGVIDQVVTVHPSDYFLGLGSSSLGVNQKNISVACTGTRQFEDIIVGTVKMNVVQAYAITLAMANGSLTLNGAAAPKVAKENTEFTLAAVPAEGYELGVIKIFKTSNESEVTEEVLSGSTLTMPAYAITISATFTALPNGECGKQGDNLLWMYNPTSKVLTITGSGEMADYTHSYSDGSNTTPWDQYRNDITSVVLPNGITSIGNWAFGNFKALTAITLPNTITVLGESAFNYSTALVSINMPTQLQTIGKMAFFNTRITSLTIPASVTSVGQQIVGAVTTLTAISVEAGNTVYDSRNNCNAIIRKCDNVLIVGCKNSTIPSDITGIADWAFDRGYAPATVELPAGVTSIGEHAFFYGRAITLLRIPVGVTSISSQAFSSAFDADGADVYVEWTTPLVVFDDIVVATNVANATLHVPYGTKSLYEAANGWKHFGTIVEADKPTGLDDAMVSGDSQVRKVIIDSKLFIIRGDKMFDAQGKLVK